MRSLFIRRRCFRDKQGVGAGFGSQFLEAVSSSRKISALAPRDLLVWPYYVPAGADSKS
jgi:hypothetical protein